MKRLALVLILIAAAPAVADASMNFMRDVSGRTEVVADSYSFDRVRLAGSKSSRPQCYVDQTNSPTSQPTSTPGWL